MPLSVDAAAPQFLDRAIRITPVVTVGEFRCTVGHPRFEDSGRIRQDCFVFPRLAVAIEHEHEAPFVANAAVATFYNAGQAYRRLAISADGDRCDWFGVTREVALDVVSSIDPAMADRAGGPFGWTRGPVDARWCLDERAFMRCLRSGASIDDAAVEERVIWWLVELAGAGRRHLAPARALTRRSRDAVHETERLLSEHWREPWSLADLSRAAGLSVYHLCRAFRQVTGRTIHQYREALRLRESLDALQRETRSITDIALDAGFSSHSHFTAAFRREFGRTPSQVRAPFP
ncbi:MAG: AraC family transcriptional regulator [Vicinamibacterales bacterium]